MASNSTNRRTNACKENQSEELTKLISLAKYTQFGQKHNFASIKDYASYCKNVPISSYSDLEPYIEETKSGKKDVLYPGVTNQFAVSSGTTGSGKHIPVTADRLKSDRRFMRKVVLHSIKKSRILLALKGYQLSLPGTIETHQHNGNTIKIGEISGYLGSLTPWYLRPMQVVPGNKLIQMEWSEKFEAVLTASIDKDVRIINAAPPWVLIVFQEILARTGKKTIDEVWPNLSAIFCGGVALSNYISAIRELAGSVKPDFFENYGASEGYFAYAVEPNQDSMRLITDNGVFYEWVPADENDKVDYENTKPIPTWEVKANQRYGLIITSNSGLWRYKINDLVEFTDPEDLRIKVAGRTSNMLDEHGEMLYYSEAYKTMEDVCREVNAAFSVFSLSGIMSDTTGQPNHHYFVNWIKKPENIEKFAQTFDKALQKINRHYAIRRDNAAIGEPEFYSLTHQQIQEWITGGKAFTQSKIPEIIHSKDKAQRIMQMAKKEKEISG